MDLASAIYGAKIGDQRSQSWLVDNYSGRLAKISEKIFRNKNDAKEALNDAFNRILKKIGTYKECYPFDPWIRRVAIHVFFRIRKRKKLKIVMTEFTDEDLPVAPEVDLKMNVEEIEILIDQLPYCFRTVFYLYVMEGLDHKEIAEGMGIKETSCRTNYYKARHKILTLIDTKNKKHEKDETDETEQRD